jgi:UDP-N-acetylglucosamine 2-epimerase (non-hydrolysing)
LLNTAAIAQAIKISNRISPDYPIRHIQLDMRQSTRAVPYATFFNDIDLPAPDVTLTVPAAATPAEKSAMVCERFSDIIATAAPNVVMISGTSDQSVSCAVIAKKFRFARPSRGERGNSAVAFVAPEATMIARSPTREINGLLLCTLADYVFACDDPAAETFFRRAGSLWRTHFVGSLGADNVLRCWARAMNSSILADLQLATSAGIKSFALVAFRETTGAQGVVQLQRLQPGLSDLARQMPVVCPADRGLLLCIRAAGLEDYFVDHFVDKAEGCDGRVRIRIIPPVGYLDFVKLVSAAKLILTDSPEIEMAASLLGAPCGTLAPGSDPAEIGAWARKIRCARPLNRSLNAVPLRSDGRTAERIIEILRNDFLGRVETKPRAAISPGS